MQRQSEEALGLLRTSDEVNASIETHGPGVAKKLAERWMSVPMLDGSTLEVEGPSQPDFLGNLYTVRDGLDASAKALRGADQAHVHQLAEVIRLREERKEVTGNAYEKFSMARRVMDDVHGSSQSFVLAGIEGPTSRKPSKLQRQLDMAHPRLTDPNLKLPKAKVDGIEVDPMAMGRDLEQESDKLRTVQGDFLRARRVAQETRKEKNRRIADHRTNITQSGQIVEGYYRMAGETELADRLRPALRRASGRRTAQPPSEESASEESTSEVSAPEESASVGRTTEGQPPRESVSGETREGSAVAESLTGSSDGSSPADV